jgi:hypothetical protein
MALPMDVRGQIAQREARLRLVPTDETPPAEETRAQVQRRQDQVHEVAEAIHWADATIEQLASMSDAAAAERDPLIVVVREIRARAFDLMRQLNPGIDVICPEAAPHS